MTRRTAVRHSGLLSVILAGALHGSALPAQQKSGAPASNPVTNAVTFQDGVLYIQAANLPLQELLAEIVRRTGVRISGPVAADRVYGNYGPGDPQRVLATLLSGTGTNLLILSNPSNKLVEVVLTPRQGPASPPAPSTGSQEEAAEEPPASRPLAAATRPGDSTGRPPGPPAGGEQGGTPPDAQGNATPGNGESGKETDATAAASAAADGEGSNNAVKTPEQIFQQLQRLRQQQSGAAQP